MIARRVPRRCEWQRGDVVPLTWEWAVLADSMGFAYQACNGCTLGFSSGSQEEPPAIVPELCAWVLHDYILHNRVCTMCTQGPLGLSGDINESSLVYIYMCILCAALHNCICTIHACRGR